MYGFQHTALERSLMPGPMPKDPAVRQRRNRATTATTFGPVVLPAEWPPELPVKPGGGQWGDAARAWWSAVWASPVAHEIFPSDVGGLVRLAWLVDEFERTQRPAVAAEIRMMESEFGLTPRSRHVLAHAAARVAAAKNGE